MDAAKAPGYRGNSINSPVSSKTSSNSVTPPSTTLPQHNVSNSNNANGNVNPPTLNQQPPPSSHNATINHFNSAADVKSIGQQSSTGLAVQRPIGQNRPLSDPYSRINDPLQQSLLSFAQQQQPDMQSSFAYMGLSTQQQQQVNYTFF